MTMPPISFSPPPWLLDEARNRVVLLLNHVLQQEPEAMQRLRRQAGKTIQLRWPHAALARVLPGALALHITPAGLLAQARADAPADLVLTLDEPSAFTLAGKLASGDKPTVGIEGDVQLAAEVAWLVDNVRWDLEEDLSPPAGRRSSAYAGAGGPPSGGPAAPRAWRLRCKRRASMHRPCARGWRVPRRPMAAEARHEAMAAQLGDRLGRFSLWPRRAGALWLSAPRCLSAAASG
jgi:ubiquinone biosynthesis protein UbiJ